MTSPFPRWLYRFDPVLAEAETNMLYQTLRQRRMGYGGWLRYLGPHVLMDLMLLILGMMIFTACCLFGPVLWSGWLNSIYTPTRRSDTRLSVWLGNIFTRKGVMVTAATDLWLTSATGREVFTVLYLEERERQWASLKFLGPILISVSIVMEMLYISDLNFPPLVYAVILCLVLIEAVVALAFVFAIQLDNARWSAVEARWLLLRYWDQGFTIGSYFAGFWRVIALAFLLLSFMVPMIVAYLIWLRFVPLSWVANNEQAILENIHYLLGLFVVAIGLQVVQVITQINMARSNIKNALEVCPEYYERLMMLIVAPPKRAG